MTPSILIPIKKNSPQNTSERATHANICRTKHVPNSIILSVACIRAPCVLLQQLDRPVVLSYGYWCLVGHKPLLRSKCHVFKKMAAVVETSDSLYFMQQYRFLNKTKEETGYAIVTCSFYFTSINLKVLREGRWSNPYQEIASGLLLSALIASHWMFSRIESNIKSHFCCLSYKMFYLGALHVQDLFLSYVYFLDASVNQNLDKR